MTDQQNSDPAMQQAAAQALVDEYVHAVGDKDVSRCVGLFADDATLSFMSGVFKGRTAIEDWHKERIANELQIVKVDNVRVKGETVTVDGAVTSKRLRQWKIPKLGGRMTIRLEGNRIKELTFGLRAYNPLEGW